MYILDINLSSYYTIEWIFILRFRTSKASDLELIENMLKSNIQLEHRVYHAIQLK